MYLVGKVSGIVIDKLDNMVTESPLKFECQSDAKIDYPASTDAF